MFNVKASENCGVAIFQIDSPQLSGRNLHLGPDRQLRLRLRCSTTCICAITAIIDATAASPHAWLGNVGWSGELAGGARLEGPLLYLTMPAVRARDATTAANLLNLLSVNSVGPYRTAATNRALRWAGNWWRPTGTGGATTPYVWPLIGAHWAQRGSNPANTAELRTMLHNTADYFLGANPLHTSWITGLGPRPPTGIFSFDDWASGSAQRSGMIPYGPDRVGNLWFWWPMHIPENQAYAYDTTYPPILVGVTPDNPLGDGIGCWPNHEAWFDLATAPQTGEFTVHQNHLSAAWFYGYLMTVSESLAFPAADINQDGAVDATDLMLVRNQFGRSGAALGNPRCDLNGDGRVDAIDLGLVSRAIGH